MKACRVCGRLYPEDAGFCPVDGQELYSATQVPVASDDNDPRVGQLLQERYQVRRVVADGGMGRVYEALDMHERRNVAMKVLHPDIARDDVQVERFKREFEVSAQLPHDHIVEVTDYQPTRDGSWVLVMEFLYGEELRAYLKRSSAMKPERLIRMMSQLAIGLDAAHERKFVHRDLKPDNVFLCQTPEGDIVKILDFGSVKDKTSTAKKLTVMGTTIGSPFYMAPEQAQGLETLDQRADVWALAAMTYECLTGVLPFQGANGPSILLEILTKEPDPPSLVGKDAKYPIPPTVDRVLAQAMKKTPGMRTETAGEYADALGRAYGLEGDHHVWAKTAESELAVQVAAKLDEVMKSIAPAAPADETADAFFGEGDSLGLDAPGPVAPTGPMPASPMQQAPAPAPGPMVPGGPPATASIPGVPRSGGVPSWLLLGGVMVVALVAGVLIAFLVP